MNTKVVGSIVRWALVISGAITTFMSDASFMDAFGKLKDAISSGDKVAVVGAAVTVITLGWSIWDKIKTQSKENEAEAKIKSLSNTIEVQAKALDTKK